MTEFRSEQAVVVHVCSPDVFEVWPSEVAKCHSGHFEKMALKDLVCHFAYCLFGT